MSWAPLLMPVLLASVGASRSLPAMQGQPCSLLFVTGQAQACARTLLDVGVGDVGQQKHTCLHMYICRKADAKA